MNTIYNKVLASLITGALIFLNQKFGWKIPADADTVTFIATTIVSMVVFFTPNKITPDQVNAPASPSSGNFGGKVGAFILFAWLSSFAQPGHAYAADLTLPVKADASGNALTSNCSLANCSGFYVGMNIMGVGSNMDILGSGINGSVFAGGGSIGLDGGYQFWNGKYFLAGEVFGDYTTPPTIAGAPSPHYVFGQLLKIGMALDGLIGQSAPSSSTPSQSPTAVTVPSALASMLASPYIQFGAVERPWGTGWANGAGLDFVIASGWNLDLSYLYVTYNGATLNAVQSEKSENLIKISFNRKF